MTENQLREIVVNTFIDWIGYSETNGNYKKIIDLYNTQKILPRGYKVKYSDEWCATTVSAVGIKLGLLETILPECSCSKMIELYKEKGLWQEKDNYIPKIADIIMYNWEDSGVGDNISSPDHVGMIASITGNTLKIIEGNKNQSVAYRTVTINGKFIRGYCLPDYTSKANNFVYNSQKTTSTTSTINKSVTKLNIELEMLQTGSQGKQVKALQILLNGVGSSCGMPDSVFGSKTEFAVKDFQGKNRLTKDGAVGLKTWNKLLKGE